MLTAQPLSRRYQNNLLCKNIVISAYPFFVEIVIENVKNLVQNARYRFTNSKAQSNVFCGNNGFSQEADIL